MAAVGDDRLQKESGETQTERLDAQISESLGDEAMGGELWVCVAAGAVVDFRSNALHTRMVIIPRVTRAGVDAGSM